MRVPRPDLDALIWLTALEFTDFGTADRSPGRLHAVRAGEAYCRDAGDLDVLQLLWIDRARAVESTSAQQCMKCEELEHRTEGAVGEAMTLIYSARQGKKDRDLTRHIFSLGSAFSEADYRIDIARTAFDDGIGCTFSLWRRVEPATPADPKVPPPKS